MKNKTLLVILSITLVLSLVLFAACPSPTPTTAPTTAPTTVPTTAPTTAPEAKTLKIGYLGGITGWFSIREIPDMNQLEITADYINEQGGVTVNGQKYLIEIVTADYESDFDGTVAAANYLIYEEDIKLILGPMCIFAPAIASLCDSIGVLRVINWCNHTPGEVDASTPYAFMGGNSVAAGCLANVYYLKENYPDITKVVICTPDDAVDYLPPVAEKFLNAAGISVVGVVDWNVNQTDFHPTAAKINSFEDGQAIFAPNALGPHTAGTIKALRELKNNNPYMVAAATSLAEIVGLAGVENCVGLSTCSVAGYVADDPNCDPVGREIISRIRAEYGEDYSVYLNAGQNLWVLKEVIEAAQSLDPDVIKAKWESMDTVSTIFGPGTIGGDETCGIKHHYVTTPQHIEVVKDGKIVSGGWVDFGALP
jgi:ABC-type branched-subunit amino acid transport system substrate-binding protein